MPQPAPKIIQGTEKVIHELKTILKNEAIEDEELRHAQYELHFKLFSDQLSETAMMDD